MTIAKETVDDIWYDATNSVCQTMQDRDMCKCQNGDCLAAGITPQQADYAYHVGRGLPERKTPWKDTRRPRRSYPPGRILGLDHDGEPIWSEDTPQRQPIRPGEYGRVQIVMTPGGCETMAFIDLINPHLGMTADELREVAHLFNQIAEVLEDCT